MAFFSCKSIHVSNPAQASVRLSSCMHAAAGRKPFSRPSPSSTPPYAGKLAGPNSAHFASFARAAGRRILFKVHASVNSHWRMDRQATGSDRMAFCEASQRNAHPVQGPRIRRRPFAGRLAGRPRTAPTRPPARRPGAAAAAGGSPTPARPAAAAPPSSRPTRPRPARSRARVVTSS